MLPLALLKKIRVYNYISYVLHVFDLPSGVTEVQQFENQFQSVFTQFSSVLPIGAIFYNYCRAFDGLLCRVIQSFLHYFQPLFLFSNLLNFNLRRNDQSR